MRKTRNQLTDPRLSQRRNPSLNFRNNSWKQERKKNKEERLFKFKRPIWSYMNVATHNVKGCSGKQADKLDHIANMINNRKTPTIYLIQETWMSEEKGETLIDDVLFISYGCEKEPDETRAKNGGVSIALSKSAQKAWKRAGQPDPIRPGRVAKTARNIGLELHFLDSKKKIIKLFVISTYLPCSTYDDNEFDETLEQLQNIINQCPKDAIPIIGGDFNASIGVNDINNINDNDINDNDINGTTGTFGNPYRNDRGETLRTFLIMNNLCSTSTFFKKNNYNTYSWCGNEENPKQIDHIFIRKEDKKRVINCETGDTAGVMSDHHSIDNTIRLAEHIPRKKNSKTKNNRTHQSIVTEEKKKKKKIEWYKILERPDDFKDLLYKNITDSKSTSNPNNNTNNIIIDTNNNNINSNNINTIMKIVMIIIVIIISFSNNNNIDPYDQLSECIKITAEELFDGDDNVRKRKPWFELSQKALLEKINARNKSFGKYSKDKSISNLTILKNSRSNLKKKKEEAKILWIASKVSELESCMDIDPRSAWKATKEIAGGLYGHHKNTASMKMKKPNGEYCTNDLENAEVFKNFYLKLYNNHEGTKFDESILNEIDEQPEKPILGALPTDKEIQRALSKMAYEKSPGPNGIPTEAFKNLDNYGMLLLRDTIRKYWTDNQYNPEVFTRLGLCILPKTGDLSNPNKWRGIALGNIIAKLISSIIATRLTMHINTFGIDEQCGCLFGKGSADATFTLKSSLQTIREHQLEAHVLFVDLVKAFDSVNRELLWKILKLYGIPDSLIVILKKLHTNITYIMKVGEEEVEIEGTVGVKQGDNLGPILFILLVQAVASTLDKKWTFDTPDFRKHELKKDGSIKYNPSLKKKIPISTAGKAFSFWKSYYVDDAAYVFLSRKDIEDASKLIKSHFTRFGLTVHCGDRRSDGNSKTEAMYIPPPGKTATTTDTADILINEFEFFSYCNKFKYLGTIFTPSLKDDLDIQRRINQANGAFATMKRVLCNKDIPATLRIRLYNATVTNILLWGCESWALTEELRRKLEVCHHRFLRKMIGITIYDVKDNHISNEQVREELNNCYTFHQSLEMRRARWLEKLALMGCNRGPKNALRSWIYNKPRKQGGQQQHIRTSLSITLTDSLHFDSDKMNDWMLEAKLEPKKWANRIETALNLVPKSYVPLKLRKW